MCYNNSFYFSVNNYSYMIEKIIQKIKNQGYQYIQFVKRESELNDDFELELKKGVGHTPLGRLLIVYPPKIPDNPVDLDQVNIWCVALNNNMVKEADETVPLRGKNRILLLHGEEAVDDFTDEYGVLPDDIRKKIKKDHSNKTEQRKMARQSRAINWEEVAKQWSGVGLMAEITDPPFWYTRFPTSAIIIWDKKPIKEVIQCYPPIN